MSTGSVVGSRQRALEARVSVLEREAKTAREEMAVLTHHVAFLTENLDALRADNRRAGSVQVRNGVSEE